MSEKNKTNVARVYSPTLQSVKDRIKDMPGMTIIRFIDEAIKEKLTVNSFFEKWKRTTPPTPEQIQQYKNQITNEQTTGLPAERESNSESTTQ